MENYEYHRVAPSATITGGVAAVNVTGVRGATGLVHLGRLIVASVSAGPVVVDVKDGASGPTLLTVAVGNTDTFDLPDLGLMFRTSVYLVPSSISAAITVGWR